MNDTTCQACGMPMTKDDDFPAGNRSSVYCVHCGDADGQLTATFSSMLDYYTDDFTKTRNLDRDAARQEASAFLATLPAWSDHAE